MRSITLQASHSNIQALVSNEDFGIVSKQKWYLHSSGYVKNNSGYLHQLILGGAPKGYEIDHINLDKLDNQRDNLRIVSIALNRQHKKAYKPYKTIVSKIFKGIEYHKPNYHARIRISGKSLYLGSFRTGEEAAKAYDEYVLSNKLDRLINFPRPSDTATDVPS